MALTIDSSRGCHPRTHREDEMVDLAKAPEAATHDRARITDWRPEDEKFWESTGKKIALRNLIWSMFALHHGFAIWLIWSIVVTRLPAAGFPYTTDQLFTLVAIPGLFGSLARFPYGFAPGIFGGRNWTVIQTALLFIPCLSLAYLVTQPDTPLWLMMVSAATAGFGGGTFSASMNNMSYFYPARLKGTALGWNAGVGNLGVSVVQLIVPLLLGSASSIFTWQPPPRAASISRTPDCCGSRRSRLP